MVAGACTQICIGRSRQVLKLGNQWVSHVGSWLQVGFWDSPACLSTSSTPPSRASHLHRLWEHFGDFP